MWVTLAAQPRWTWFMVWAEWLTDPAYNPNERVQQTYWHPRVLNRGEINLGSGGGRTGPITGIGGNTHQQWTCNGQTNQDWNLPT